MYLLLVIVSSCVCSDQLPVSTKFDMRSDPGVVRNYGKLLVEMVSVVPDGVVCFFVSYSYMDGIIATWNETGILKVKVLLPRFTMSLLFSQFCMNWNFVVAIRH